MRLRRTRELASGRVHRRVVDAFGRDERRWDAPFGFVG